MLPKWKQSMPVLDVNPKLWPLERGIFDFVEKRLRKVFVATGHVEPVVQKNRPPFLVVLLV